MQGITKVFQKMNEKGMDFAILTNSANVKYVSGFDVPFWPAWMGDVSNGLPMVTAVNNIAAYKVILKAEGVISTTKMRRPMENLTKEQEESLLSEMNRLDYKHVLA